MITTTKPLASVLLLEIDHLIGAEAAALPRCARLKDYCNQKEQKFGHDRTTAQYFVPRNIWHI